MNHSQLLAKVNFFSLSANSYPGRGVLAGELDHDFVLGTWTMGRSEMSRNRVYEVDGTRVYTSVADPAKKGGDALTIYNAMRERGNLYVASNGEQTDLIDSIRSPGQFADWIFDQYSYEPDLSCTPRITVLLAPLYSKSANAVFQFSLIAKSQTTNDPVHYQFACETTGNGFAYALTTYERDGNPLPSFRGPPLLLPLAGNPEEVVEQYWSMLDAENRVSLALKFISRTTGKSRVLIRNQYEKKS